MLRRIIQDLVLMVYHLNYGNDAGIMGCECVSTFLYLQMRNIGLLIVLETEFVNDQ